MHYCYNEFLYKQIMNYRYILALFLTALFSVIQASAEDVLPQMYIEYSGALSKNMDYIHGTLALTDSDGSTVSYDNILLKTRGATAKDYANKPALNIKFRTAEGDELDTDLLGLRKASTFILDAMAIDRINMRNRVAFDIWNSFSRLPYETDFGSRNGTVGRFVEVFLNGKYKGIYCLSDKINRKLLDLKKPEVDEAAGTVTVRGVLYKNGTNDIGNQNTPGFFNDYSVYVAAYHDAWELHEPDDYPSEEVWAPLAELYSNGNKESYRYVKEHFFLENLADYTIHIMALSIADNWGAKNRYFSVRNITKTDDRGKFVITPWDLDTSLGGSYKGAYYGGQYSSWAVGDVAKNPPMPIAPCMGQPEFRSLLKKRWIEGSLGAFAVDSVKERLESYADLFIDSGAWQRTLEAANNHDLTVTDLKEEVRLIGEWYERRFEEMDRYFNVTAAEREEAAGIEGAVEERIPSENYIYNIQGIRVNDMNAPGLYIVNGKKILVRP